MHNGYIVKHFESVFRSENKGEPCKILTQCTTGNQNDRDQNVKTIVVIRISSRVFEIFRRNSHIYSSTDCKVQISYPMNSD